MKGEPVQNIQYPYQEETQKREVLQPVAMQQPIVQQQVQPIVHQPVQPIVQTQPLQVDANVSNKDEKQNAMMLFLIGLICFFVVGNIVAMIIWIICYKKYKKSSNSEAKKYAEYSKIGYIICIVLFIIAIIFVAIYFVIMILFLVGGGIIMAVSMIFGLSNFNNAREEFENNYPYTSVVPEFLVTFVKYSVLRIVDSMKK